jgi:hypothetical protein
LEMKPIASAFRPFLSSAWGAAGATLALSTPRPSLVGWDQL